MLFINPPFSIFTILGEPVEHTWISQCSCDDNSLDPTVPEISKTRITSYRAHNSKISFTGCNAV